MLTFVVNVVRFKNKSRRKMWVAWKNSNLHGITELQPYYSANSEKTHVEGRAMHKLVITRQKIPKLVGTVKNVSQLFQYSYWNT